MRIREWEWEERGERRGEEREGVRAGVCIGKGEGFRFVDEAAGWCQGSLLVFQIQISSFQILILVLS